MKKFYFKDEEIHVGDTISMVLTISVPGNGETKVKIPVKITESNLDSLIDQNIITTKEEKSSKHIPMDLNYYIQNIANKMGWNIDKTYNYLNNIDFLYPAAALGIILKEIAIELDMKYPDTINNSPTIFIVSTLDGTIRNVNKTHIKNYRNFAAFRTVEDAKIACHIVKDILKDMFKYEVKD